MAKRKIMTSKGIGRHKTIKNETDSTYNKEWSGVSYAKHCKQKCVCPRCGSKLHAEAGNHYCPFCDDYVRPEGKYHEAL